MTIEIPQKERKRPRWRAEALKQLRYPSEVTLCIAGLCRDWGIKKDVFVLCSDCQLDQADWGSTEAGVKIAPLGYNWAVQLAGNWPTATELARFLKTHVKAHDCPTDRAEMVERLRDGANRFAASALYDKKSSCALLITGYIEDDSLMLRMELSKDDISIGMEQEFCTIGEGCYAANILLQHRQFNRYMGLESACYSAYEAKRFSETVSSVGKGTRLAIQYPCTKNEKDKVCATYLNERGLEIMEALRRDLSFKPIPALRFRDEMFS